MIEGIEMNPKSALEFKPVCEPSRPGGFAEPEVKYKRKKKRRRNHARHLLKRAWIGRPRRRSAAQACVATAHLLSSGEERDLAERIKAGDDGALQKLITSNLGLVLTAVNDYMRYGVAEDDLIQEGNLGLIRAARHFDPAAHTTRFATYATYWIRCFMVRAMASNGSLIQRPEKSHLLRVQYRRALAELKAMRATASGEAGSSSPGIDEIAGYLGIAPARLEQARLPLTQQATCESLGDLAIADGPAPDLCLVTNEDRALVCAALARLSPFEAWVICERYGLDEPSLRVLRLAVRPDNTSHETDQLAPVAGSAGVAEDPERRPGDSYFQRSYIEMGRDCGLSVFRLRQVEKTALDKLRTELAGCASPGT
jgi:RNA polymerase primary sigma factor